MLVDSSPMIDSGRPVRVLHLITDLQLGGAERMFARLLPRFDRGTVAVRAVSMRSMGLLGKELRDGGVPVDALGLSSLRQLPLVVAKLVAICREFQPDVLQSWLYHADLVAAVAGRIARVPRIAWNIRNVEHRSELSPAARSLQWALTRVSSAVDVAVANSERGRETHIARGYRCRRWVVLPNGIDTATYAPRPDHRDRLRAELALSDEHVAIGLVARADPLKDHSTFLEAAALLARERPLARFVLVGRGIPDELRARVEAAGLGAVVRLLDERRDVVELLGAFDIGTLTSRSEGFPNALLEAMACALPCVSTDVGEAAIMLDTPSAIAPPGDARAIAAAWRALVDMTPEQRRDRGREHRRRVEANYALDAVARRYEAMYLAMRSGS